MDQQRQQSRTPIAALRFATLKNLTSSGSSAEQTLHRLAELLSQSKLRGTFQLRLLREGKMEGATVSNVAFGNTKAKAGTKAKRGTKPSRPTVELITTPETWVEIASGKMAPHDAFLGGRMRVRGDVRVVQLMLKHLAGSEGMTSVCRREEQ